MNLPEPEYVSIQEVEDILNVSFERVKWLLSNNHLTAYAKPSVLNGRKDLRLLKQITALGSTGAFIFRLTRPRDKGKDTFVSEYVGMNRKREVMPNVSGCECFNYADIRVYLKEVYTLRDTGNKGGARLANANIELTPPYLDPLHKHYALELATAIEVWLDLYNAGIFKEKLAHKAQIKALLKGRGLSNEAIERIAKVVNPAKTGGAPKTIL